MKNPSRGQQQDKTSTTTVDVATSPTRASPNLDKTMQPERAGAVPSGVSEPEDGPAALGSAKPSSKEPSTLEEYIENFLSGKLRSFSEELGRKIARNPSYSPSMSPEARGRLLRLAQEADVSLEKAKQLMQFARQTGPYRALGRTMREFSRDLVCLHPVIQGVLPRDELFPGTSEAPSLGHVWGKLFPPGTKLVPSKKRKPTKSPDANDPPNGGNAVPGQQPPQEPAPTESVATKELAKARKNAFLCGTIWRHAEGLMNTTEVIRDLKQTLYTAECPPDSLDGELVDALTSAPDKEAERLALYMEWSANALALERSRVTDLQLQLYRLQEARDDLQNQLASERESHAQTVTRAETAENARADALANLGTQRTHSRADFEGLRAASLSVVNHAVSELSNVEIALTREVPKTQIAAEVVKDVIDGLEAHIRELEAKK